MLYGNTSRRSHTDHNINRWGCPGVEHRLTARLEHVQIWLHFNVLNPKRGCMIATSKSALFFKTVIIWLVLFSWGLFESWMPLRAQTKGLLEDKAGCRVLTFSLNLCTRETSSLMLQFSLKVLYISIRTGILKYSSPALHHQLQRGVLCSSFLKLCIPFPRLGSICP